MLSMAITRTRKQKENPHYNFLYSWQPKGGGEARVKGESKTAPEQKIPKSSASKNAEIQAKDESTVRIKKDIIRSLFLVSFILALELVVYLAWKRFLS